MSKYIVEIYRERISLIEDFIEEHGTVFHSYDFLISVGKSYKCVVVKNIDSNIIHAVLPLVKSSKYKVLSYNRPPFAYFYGPVFANGISMLFKLEVFSKLYAEVESSKQIDFRCSWEADVLPYTTKGLSVSVSQSHGLSKENSFDLGCLNKDKSRDLKKLLKLVESGRIRILEGKGNVLEVIKLWDKTAKRSGFNPHVDYLKRIVNNVEFYSNMIIDDAGTILAGTICPFDKHSMYYLVSASNRDSSNNYTRANILSLYLAIQKANDDKLNFDFEGSNIKGVAEFYRSMGGKPIQIVSCVKTQSLYYKIIDFIKSI